MEPMSDYFSDLDKIVQNDEQSPKERRVLVTCITITFIIVITFGIFQITQLF